METKNQHNIIHFSSPTGEFSHDPFVSEHWLVSIVSGFSEVFSTEGIVAHPPGTLGLVRKNQLVKTVNKPDGEKPFRSISICIDQQSLKKFSDEYNVKADGIYSGEPNIALENDEFMKAYFNSLMPYFSKPEKLTPRGIFIKHLEQIPQIGLKRKDWKRRIFKLVGKTKSQVRSIWKLVLRIYHISLLPLKKNLVENLQRFPWSNKIILLILADHSQFQLFYIGIIPSRISL